MDAATTGALLEAEPGWSSRDELLLATLNQLILQRRMWADEHSGRQLEPVRMPWHSRNVKRSTLAEVRAFFGAGARLIKRE